MLSLSITITFGGDFWLQMLFSKGHATADSVHAMLVLKLSLRTLL